jgi:hypothetical protein
MPNKTDDWFDRLLDRHPSEPVPAQFLQTLRTRIAEEVPIDRAGFGAARGSDTEGRALQILRPLLVAAAAVLLVSFGYMMGAGSSPEFNQITIHPEGQMAQSDLEQIFQDREILQSWDLTSDADLELVFRKLSEEEDQWLDDLLSDDAADKSASDTQQGSGTGAAENDGEGG